LEEGLMGVPVVDLLRPLLFAVSRVWSSDDILKVNAWKDPDHFKGLVRKVLCAGEEKRIMVGEAKREEKKVTYPGFTAMSEALSASWSPSVVIIGLNSFFLFLFAFPLEAFATCFAFWIAACLM
jgi:hypothetical protein